jgi:hypothetical protein
LGDLGVISLIITGGGGSWGGEEAPTPPLVMLLVNSKVHPRTGHEGPEGEQMYSSTLTSTSALDGSGWSTPLPGHFTHGHTPVPFV